MKEIQPSFNKNGGNENEKMDEGKHVAFGSGDNGGTSGM